MYGDACKEPSETQVDDIHADSGIGTETGSTRKISSINHVKSTEHATGSTRDVNGCGELDQFASQAESRILVQGRRYSLESPRVTASQLDSKWPFSRIDSIDGQPRMSREGGWRWASSSKKSNTQPEVMPELLTPPVTTGTGYELVSMPDDSLDACHIEQQGSQSFSMDESQQQKASTHSKRLSAHTITSIEALADPSFYDDCFSIGASVSARPSPSFTYNEMAFLDGVENAHIREINPVKKDGPASVETGTIRLVHSDAPPHLTTSDPNDAEVERTGSARDLSSLGQSIEPQTERQEPSRQLMPEEYITTSSEQAPSLRPKVSLKSLGDLSQNTKTVVQRFRTDEWAKRLSAAEQPGPDPIRPVEMEEAPSTIDTAALLQTPLTAEPPPFLQTTMAVETETIQSARSNSSSSDPVQYTPGGRPIPSFQFSSYGPPQRRASIGTGRRCWGADRRADSQNAGLAQHIPRHPARRSGFRPGTSTSPISENEEMSFHLPPRISLPAGTLLTERTMMLKNQDRSENLSPSSSFTHSTASTFSPSRSSDLSLAPIATDATDDIQPLSVRRQQLKLQQRASIPMMPTRRGMTYPPAPYSMDSEQTTYAHSAHALPKPYPYPFQAAPTRRTTDPSLPQRTMLSQWRASMMASADASPWTAYDDGSCLSLGQARTPYGQLVSTRQPGPEPWRPRRTSQSTQGRGTRGEAKALAGMGVGQLDAAHRQVLRRMQGDARRQLEATKIV